MRKFGAAAILFEELSSSLANSSKGMRVVLTKEDDSIYSMFMLNSEIKCSKLKNWGWSKELDCLVDLSRNLLFYIEELPTFYK